MNEALIVRGDHKVDVVGPICRGSPRVGGIAQGICTIRLRPRNVEVRSRIRVAAILYLADEAHWAVICTKQKDFERSAIHSNIESSTGAPEVKECDAPNTQYGDLVLKLAGKAGGTLKFGCSWQLDASDKRQIMMLIKRL